MGSKRHKPEEIVAKLRQVDVLTTQGQSVAEAVRSVGVTEVTYYRWRQEYGGLKGARSSGRRTWRLRTPGCATLTSSTGRSAAGPKASYEVTLHLDHPTGAGHSQGS